MNTRFAPHHFSPHLLPSALYPAFHERPLAEQAPVIVEGYGRSLDDFSRHVAWFEQTFDFGPVMDEEGGLEPHAHFRHLRYSFDKWQNTARGLSAL